MAILWRFSRDLGYPMAVQHSQSSLKIHNGIIIMIVYVVIYNVALFLQQN